MIITKNTIHKISLSLIILIFIIGQIVADSPQQKNVLLVSGFGFLALLSMIFLLFVPLFFKLKKNSFTSGLLANRRYIGRYLFVFAFIHVFLVYHFFYQWNLNLILENPLKSYRLVAFLILAVMMATSNNKSIKFLGKNWKRLHRLIYLALVLVLLHSFDLGKIFLTSWTLRVIVLFLVFIMIVGKVFYINNIKNKH